MFNATTKEPQMQIKYFTNGGYVAHKVMIAGIKHSAWFDEFGNIVDAERIDVLGRSTAVKKGSFAWHELQSMAGKRENFEDWNKPHCVRPE
jgi:hypothetical protein